MDASISQGIIDLLDGGSVNVEMANGEEIKIDLAELKNLVTFLRAVERGKKLHPGPFTKEEWQEDLEEERIEVDETVCWPDCSLCRLDDSSPPCIELLKKRQAELLDEAVVTYRASLAMRDLIAEKEAKVTKEAMEHDPR